jgi:SET domain-containing protein
LYYIGAKGGSARQWAQFLCYPDSNARTHRHAPLGNPRQWRFRRRTNQEGHTFLFTLNDTYVIDANVGGNSARWINHSCDPNCEAVMVEDDDGDPNKDAVFIEAIRAIKPGEELTYNYGIVLAEAHTARMKKLWACRCGASKCTGTMLQPKRKAG